MTALLQVSELHAAYGQTRVLHGIDFAMEEGSITALLGANGALQVIWLVGRPLSLP